MTAAAWMVLADSNAESDPGNTYYVNAGLGRAGYFAVLPADVNEYGYRHSYGLVPKKKTYGYRLKPQPPVAVVDSQPIVPLGHPAPPVGHPLLPVSPLPPVPHPVTPTSFVHHGVQGPML